MWDLISVYLNAFNITPGRTVERTWLTGGAEIIKRKNVVILSWVGEIVVQLLLSSTY